MRVAHVGTLDSDSADGTEKTLAGLVSRLPSHGIEVEVWQPTVGASAPCEHVVDGTRVWKVPAYPAPMNFGRGWPPRSRAFFAERQSHVDVVHFHSGFIPEASAMAAVLRVPYVCAPNGAYSPANLRGRNAWFKHVWFGLRELPFVRGAAFVHTVSPGEDEVIHRLIAGIPTLLAPNAIDLSSVPHLPRRHDRSADLVFLGRLAVEQKGLDLLLEAYAAFLRQTGDLRSRLLFVGPDYRGGRLTIQRLVARLELARRVMLHEPAFGRDKWAVLANAYALVYPSRWDGLPFSVLEALAAQVPVLVTPGTNLDELVQRYRAGVVVDGRVESIARGIRQLLAAPIEQRFEMGRRARELVQAHFAWPAVAARMADAYRALA